jgi:peptidoglycan/xylan/chitin deacetylase (PgdA/CDA1 family)
LRLPILLYHAIDDDPPGWIAPFTVRPRVFREHLAMVRDSGRQPVTARQVVDSLLGRAPLPDRPVLITFDDGFADFAATAAPALAAHCLPATLFVTTGVLGPTRTRRRWQAEMLTMREVVQLEADGVEIGSHTRTHPQLDTLGRAAVRTELVDSQRDLEEALGRAVTLLAYPYGYSSRAVRDSARECGYEAAFAVRDSISSTADDLYRIARLTVRADTPPERLAAWLGECGAPLAPYPERLTTRGWRWYRRTRATLAR